MRIVNERSLKLSVGGHVELDALYRDGEGEADLLRLIFRSEGARGVATLTEDEALRLADMLAEVEASPGWRQIKFAGDGGGDLAVRTETSVDAGRMREGFMFELAGARGYVAFVPDDEAKALLDLIRMTIWSRSSAGIPPKA